MSVGDDDTVASSLPAITAESQQVSEVVAGRYRIVRWLGGGGMGRVYEALDTELGEKVALTVLRAGLSEEAIARFRREVRLTCRIQHKNVARMFDIGEHAGDKFLTMELVDGEPLSRRVGRPMPWPELKALAEQLCEGLAAAHAAGVIHRDLKPDNVLVEAATGRAVITDFGIARSIDDAGVTQVGTVVGTPRYMAPEQLAGKDVDAHADLFSLGVMLFELATGERPWSGDNPISIAVQQATVAPRSLEQSAVPPAFAASVAACLALDPDQRPASARDVGAAIAAESSAPIAAVPRGDKSKRAPATPEPAPQTTLAVLPVTCAPADQYLAEGLREDVTDTLSTTAGLRVRPAAAVSGEDPREIGQRLAVDHVVVGSLRRTPTGLRISVRLVGVADGFQIWAHKADVAEAEILAAAEQIAGGIAEALSTRAQAATRPIDPRAVDLYLRARAELRRFWGNHVRDASQLLEQAAEYAPASPQILSALALAKVQTWVMTQQPEREPAARRARPRDGARARPDGALRARARRPHPRRGLRPGVGAAPLRDGDGARSVARDADLRGHRAARGARRHLDLRRGTHRAAARRSGSGRRAGRQRVQGAVRGVARTLRGDARRGRRIRAARRPAGRSLAALHERARARRASRARDLARRAGGVQRRRSPDAPAADGPAAARGGRARPARAGGRARAARDRGAQGPDGHRVARSLPAVRAARRRRAVRADPFAGRRARRPRARGISVRHFLTET
jgi:serine/threonine-protein kinase